MSAWDDPITHIRELEAEVSRLRKVVADAKAEALREALADHEATFGIACSTSREWLRYRLAALEGR